MAAAARIHIVEKGKDPRALRHGRLRRRRARRTPPKSRACSALREVIIPPASGAASALGFLAAPLSFEQVRGRIRSRSATASMPRRSTRVLDELEAEGRAQLARGRRAADAGHGRALGRHAAGRADARDQRAAAGTARSTEARLPAIRAAFAAAYTARYTAVYAGAAIEAICFRVRVPRPGAALVADQARGGGDAGAASARAARAGLVRRRLRRNAVSMTATRWCPATRSPVPRSSRSARRPPSCRPATR